MKKRGIVVLGLLAGIAAHAFLGRQAIRAQSPTFDEPLHLTAGYAYWKTGDYRLNALHHPPLPSLSAAVPLLFMKPELPLDHPAWLRPQWDKPSRQYGFAHEFLYHNRSGVPADALMAAGRGAMLALSCLFLVGLYAAGAFFFGPVAGGTAFFLGAFSPSLLAHGTLVTTDFLFTAFYFLFFCALRAWETCDAARRPWWAALAGIFLALSFCSKFSAVATAPVLLLWLLKWRFQPPVGIKDTAVGLAAAVLMTAVVYQFGEVRLFWEGLRFTVERVQGGRSTFFWGRRSTEGWWYYFPAVFLLKTSPAVLVGLVAAAPMLRKGEPLWFVVVPPTVFFVLACASSVQIGHRHILPVYPFLFLLLGWAAQRCWGDRRRRLIVAALGVWLAADTVTARPFFLSYMTPPARRAPYELLTDSNVDWGQGLRALGDYLRRQDVKKIYLSYFGTAEPAAYGIAHESVAPYTLPSFPDDPEESGPPAKALLVVSATNYQSTYFAEDVFGWLKSRRPLTMIAKSLLVFDVTHDADAHDHLAEIFVRMGKVRSAERTRSRAASLRGERSDRK